MVSEDQDLGVSDIFSGGLVKNYFEGWKTKVTTLPMPGLAALWRGLGVVGGLIGSWLLGGFCLGLCLVGQFWVRDPFLRLFLSSFQTWVGSRPGLNGMEVALLENWSRRLGCIAKGSVWIYLGPLCVIEYPVSAGFSGS